MIKYGKYVGVVFVGLLCWYVGNNFYLYYYNTIDPMVTLHDFDEGSYFAGKVTGKLSGMHPYKIATYSMFIDGKLAKQNQPVHRASFENCFSFPVMDMENGKHKISFVASSGARAQNKVEISRTFHVDNAELQAGLIRSEEHTSELQSQS